MEIVKLKKVFPTWNDGVNGAFFKKLETLYAASHTWLTGKGLILDFDYFGNISGNKTVSPLIDSFIETNAEETTPTTLTDTQKTVLCNIAITRFGDKWDKLYEALQIEYEPLENYSMTQTETPNITKKMSVSEDFAITDETKTKTDISTSLTGGSETSVYGFNSPASVPSGESDTSSTSRTQGADSDNKSTSTRTQDGYTQEQETGTRTLVRSGNIGVTTSQQMLESEFKVREYDFFLTMFADVDKILSTKIYSLE